MLSLEPTLTLTLFLTLHPEPRSKSLPERQTFPTGDIFTGAIVAGANVGSPAT